MAEEKPSKDAAAEPPAADKPAAATPSAETSAGKPAGDTSAGAEAGKTAVRRQRIKGGKHVSVGIVHIQATFNNTMVSITDLKGEVIAWSSAGRCGFKGSRKSTAYAATVVAQEAAKQATGHGMHEVEVWVQGPGAGRESAIRAIQSAGLNITAIKDVTPIPHNGCRPPKRRRV
jgi:small subunit ribosomal protein S11